MRNFFLVLSFLLSSTAVAQGRDANLLPAVRTTECNIVLNPVAVMVEALEQLPGWGLMTPFEERENIFLEAEDFKLLRQPRLGTDPRTRDRISHFSLRETTLTFKGARTIGQRTLFVFEGDISPKTKIVAGFTIPGNDPRSAIDVTIAVIGGDRKLQARLGPAGICRPVLHIDIDRNVTDKGCIFQFGSNVYTTIHVPEEIGPGSPKWVPTGSGSFSVDVKVSADKQTIEVVARGYAVKR